MYNLIVYELVEIHVLIKLRLYQPRTQALPSRGGKTLVGAGHVIHRKLIA